MNNPIYTISNVKTDKNWIGFRYDNAVYELDRNKIEAVILRFESALITNVITHNKNYEFLLTQYEPLNKSEVYTYDDRCVPPVVLAYYFKEYLLQRKPKDGFVNRIHGFVPYFTSIDQYLPDYSKEFGAAGITTFEHPCFFDPSFDFTTIHGIGPKKARKIDLDLAYMGMTFHYLGWE